ncbi:unnamed protein product [Mytilus edulis]|uniref:Uncharacterized protein n=1 Tax=Mytilus edulis TaxID=6550 RepID=A0A8S3V8R5_MYTED|nr:unnamed protein product [Mytilus edulis]
MGDMNARTGKCPDFITGDSCQINNFDAKNLIPNYYEVDTEISRNNQDNVTNVQGKSLLELCIASRLRILNGRFIGDSLGYYTYMSINGYSAVDYALISESLLSSVKYFKTDDFTYLSDHYLYTLIISYVIEVNCQRCLKPERVLTCPRSAYAWLIESRLKCANSDHYHCLETDIQTLIDCCMLPLNISKGHRPRYNSRKNVIQEIPCEDDFFMPHDYPSNRYPDNGPSHCKIKKGSCTGDGMKMCSTGSTTRDATCYCDHTQNYVPRLLSTSPCFLQFENECMVTSSCNVIIEYRVKLMYSTESQCKTTNSYETTSEFPLTTDNAFNTITTISNSVSDNSQAKKDSNLSTERLLLIIYILSAILAVLLSCITVYFVKHTIEKKDQTTNFLRIHDIVENQESQYVEMHACKSRHK